MRKYVLGAALGLGLVLYNWLAWTLLIKLLVG